MADPSLENREEATAPALTLQEINDWRANYDEISNHPPIEGDFLYAKSLNGQKQKIRLEIEFVRGKEPFIFTRAYVPLIVGDEVCWFAQGVNDPNTCFGWKVVLAPRSKNEIIRKFGLKEPIIPVSVLRIIRPSMSGNSLIAEVIEF